MDWSESGPHPRGQVIQLYDSGGLSGYDYEGCPVWFDLVGKLDPKGLLLSASPQELIRKRIRVCELLVQQCELQSQKVSSQGWDGGAWWAQSVLRVAPGPERRGTLTLLCPSPRHSRLWWDTGFHSHSATSM